MTRLFDLRVFRDRDTSDMRHISVAAFHSTGTVPSMAARPEGTNMDKAERQGLPIDPSLPEDTKAIMALQEGHERGWFSYRYPYGGGDEGERWYLVTLSGQRDRWLRSSEVLPWVLGVADTLGQPDRIAYRDGLP